MNIYSDSCSAGITPKRVISLCCFFITEKINNFVFWTVGHKGNIKVFDSVWTSFTIFSPVIKYADWINWRISWCTEKCTSEVFKVRLWLSPQTKLGKAPPTTLMESLLCYLIPDSQQLSQDRLLLLFVITLHYSKDIKSLSLGIY